MTQILSYAVKYASSFMDLSECCWFKKLLIGNKKLPNGF